MSPLVLRYATQTSPFGPITVVESERGVVRIDFAEPDLERFARRFGKSARFERRSRLSATTELAEYFRGRRRVFAASLDLSHETPFREKVLRALARVGYGELVTYGELAARVGKPKASRAVGVAMATNPIPIIVPCHRVVAADGSLGGFSAGLELKRRLHAHEGIAALDGGWEPSRRYAS